MIYMGMTRRFRSLGSGSGYPLYSRLTKTTAKKPCFSKSGDTASIPHARFVFITKSRFYKFIRNMERTTFVEEIISQIRKVASVYF
ncbi:hypothetical protein D3C86_790800 [compost metagenome]